MQAIARELNNSETAFIFPTDRPDEDVEVRFFTPMVEVPVCGHATIAAHAVLAFEGGPAGRRRQRTGAGTLLIETERTATGFRIWMHQQPASFEPPLEEAVQEKLLSALGLESPELNGRVPVQIASTGHSKVMIPVRKRSAVSKLTPTLDELSRLSAEIGCNGFYPFTLDAPDPGAVTHGRMFAPAIGIDEDPVTGNASGCLGAYMLHHQLLGPNSEDTLSFVAGQGMELGRPGRVTVQAMRPGRDGPIHVRIAGEAVIIINGFIEL